MTCPPSPKRIIKKIEAYLYREGTPDLIQDYAALLRYIAELEQDLADQRESISHAIKLAGVQ